MREVDSPDERGGQPHRAVQHGLLHQSQHPLHLLRGRLDVLLAQDHATDLSGSHVVYHVQSHPFVLEQPEVLVEGLPAHLPTG